MKCPFKLVKYNIYLPTNIEILGDKLLGTKVVIFAKGVSNNRIDNNNTNK